MQPLRLLTISAAVIVATALSASAGVSELSLNTSRRSDTAVTHPTRAYSPMPGGFDAATKQPQYDAKSSRVSSYDQPFLCYDEYPPGDDFWIDQGDWTAAYRFADIASELTAGEVRAALDTWVTNCGWGIIADTTEISPELFRPWTLRPEGGEL